jgi:hypothetical protein
MELAQNVHAANPFLATNIAEKQLDFSKWPPL